MEEQELEHENEIVNSLIKYLEDEIERVKKSNKYLPIEESNLLDGEEMAYQDILNKIKGVK